MPKCMMILYGIINYYTLKNSTEFEAKMLTCFSTTRLCVGSLERRPNSIVEEHQPKKKAKAGVEKEQPRRENRLETAVEGPGEEVVIWEWFKGCSGELFC